MTALVLRPGEIPAEITDEVIKEACRAYLGGARINEIAVTLCLTTRELKRILLTPEWRAIQAQIRDEFVEETLGRAQNLEQGLLNRIEQLLEDGVDGMSVTGERYTRKLNPKECASLWTALQGYRKGAEKTKQQEPHRRLFDRPSVIADLERFAKSKTIDAQEVH